MAFLACAQAVHLQNGVFVKSSRQEVALFRVGTRESHAATWHGARSTAFCVLLRHTRAVLAICRLDLHTITSESFNALHHCDQRSSFSAHTYHLQCCCCAVFVRLANNFQDNRLPLRPRFENGALSSVAKVFYCLDCRKDAVKQRPWQLL